MDWGRDSSWGTEEVGWGGYKQLERCRGVVGECQRRGKPAGDREVLECIISHLFCTVKYKQTIIIKVVETVVKLQLTYGDSSWFFKARAIQRWFVISDIRLPLEAEDPLILRGASIPQAIWPARGGNPTHKLWFWDTSSQIGNAPEALPSTGWHHLGIM